MLRVFATFFILFRAVLCYSQDSIPFYLDVTKFKAEENLLVVNAPYDTLKSLTQVPPGQIKTVTVLKNDTPFVRSVSRYLFTAGEPVYQNNTSLKRNYRFTWLRSFDKKLIISLRKERQFAMVETKWFTQKGIERTAIKLLPLTKLEEFEALLSTVDFWQETKAFIREGIRIDGSNWIVEGKKGDKYNLTCAYTPATQEPTRKIGEWLIANSDASGEKVY